MCKPIDDYWQVDRNITQKYSYVRTMESRDTIMLLHEANNKKYIYPNGYEYTCNP